MAATATRRRRTTRRAAALLAYDRRLGVRFVAGADEAGRGCLAGPLVVAAVCLDLDAIRGAPRRELADLDDSKALRPVVRERVCEAIYSHARQVVVVTATPGTIDADGLHVTNLRLLGRALSLLDPAPQIALVDGFSPPGGPPHRAVVGGDRTSASIAAASVVAKVTRDRLMSGPASAAHPGYGFDEHMGYATGAHRLAVRALGPSELHRMSFRSAAYEGWSGGHAGDSTP